MRPSLKIKKGDTILVTKGKNRGRRGKVLRVLPREFRIVVEGVELRKKHLRPKSAREKGQVVEQPRPFSASNVKLLCPRCSKPTRVGYRMEGEKKFRLCKKCHQEI